MSDLIIKPSGTGASLKIQNPSGTNKIVMNSSGTITTGTLGSGVTFPGAGTGANGGHILQVASATQTGSQEIGNSLTDVTGLSCTMTITSGNKVLIQGHLYFGRDAEDYGAVFIRDKDSNNIVVSTSSAQGNAIHAVGSIANYGNEAGTIYHVIPVTFAYLWTPDHTNVTVKVSAQQTFGNDSIYLNRMKEDTNDTANVGTISTLTIMEIQA